MAIRTVIFDLDGTVTDSGPGILKSVRYALEKSGRQVENLEELRGFIGPPLAAEFEKYCGISREESYRLVEYYREYYSEKGLFDNQVYEGLKETLERLADHGFTLAIATSKPEYFARIIAEHFGFADCFSYIGGAQMDGSRTDKQEVIEYVLETLKVGDRKEALMVGDRSYDMIGAKKAGLYSLGVLYGYGSREELVDAGAQRLAETPREVADIILKYAENWI